MYKEKNTFYFRRPSSIMYKNVLTTPGKLKFVSRTKYKFWLPETQVTKDVEF